MFTRLLNDLTAHTRQAAPALLVRENCHFIMATPVQETLPFLLNHLPAALHLIITTRHDPPLPRTQMRARNEPSERCPPDDALPGFRSFFVAAGLTVDVARGRIMS